MPQPLEFILYLPIWFLVSSAAFFAGCGLTRRFEGLSLPLLLLPLAVAVWLGVRYHLAYDPDFGMTQDEAVDFGLFGLPILVLVPVALLGHWRARQRNALDREYPPEPGGL